MLRSCTRPEVKTAALSWKCFQSGGYRNLRSQLPISNQIVGYVFDIDGVLIRGKKVLDPGRGAAKLLYDAEARGWRAPVAFLTNGGGVTEATRAEQLAGLLHVPVDPSQVVLSHSPMKSYAEQLNKDGHSIVTVGGPHCPAVARSYGFQRVLDMQHWGQARPLATPSARYHTLPPLTSEARDIAGLPVAAVLVMSDSREFGRDLQLMVDIVADPEGTRKEQARIIFANSDVTYPTEYGYPRLAGGTLRHALDAVLEATAVERRYISILMGKPHSINYEHAEHALRLQVCRDDRFRDAQLSAIYMIGDNPKSDVRGANTRGRPWHSVLVRTGNFRGLENDPTDPADLVVDDAQTAVEKTKVW